MVVRLRTRQNPKARKELAFWYKRYRREWLCKTIKNARLLEDRGDEVDEYLEPENLDPLSVFATWVWAGHRKRITTALKGSKEELAYEINSAASGIIMSFENESNCEPQIKGCLRNFAETESQEIRDRLAQEIRAQRKRSEYENWQVHDELLRRRAAVKRSDGRG